MKTLRMNASLKNESKFPDNPDGRVRRGDVVEVSDDYARHLLAKGWAELASELGSDGGARPDATENSESGLGPAPAPAETPEIAAETEEAPRPTGTPGEPSNAATAGAPERDAPADDALTHEPDAALIEAVGRAKANRIAGAGFPTLEAAASAPRAELEDISGVGAKTVDDVFDAYKPF
jgi:hypothetical protein